MRRRILALLLASPGVAGCDSLGVCPPTTERVVEDIHLQIVDSMTDGPPSTGIVVTLTGPVSKVDTLPASAYSSFGAQTGFNGLKAGKYILRVQHPDYLPFQASLDIDARCVNVGLSENLAIRLQRRERVQAGSITSIPASPAHSTSVESKRLAAERGRP